MIPVPSLADKADWGTANLAFGPASMASSHLHDTTAKCQLLFQIFESNVYNVEARPQRSSARHITRLASSMPLLVMRPLSDMAFPESLPPGESQQSRHPAGCVSRINTVLSRYRGTDIPSGFGSSVPASGSSKRLLQTFPLSSTSKSQGPR